MFGIPKLMIIVAIVITSILHWTTTNVCRYNFALEKRTDKLKIVTEEIDPNLGNAEVFYFRDLNCNKVDFSWDTHRLINNIQTVSVIVYQYLSTDIKGDPN
tara:strand:- start:933 stop:1235 length:303 start_codon:yes stop_codon:yes gene_type:complete